MSDPTRLLAYAPRWVHKLTIFSVLVVADVQDAGIPACPAVLALALLRRCRALITLRGFVLVDGGSVPLRPARRLTINHGGRHANHQIGWDQASLSQVLLNYALFPCGEPMFGVWSKPNNLHYLGQVLQVLQIPGIVPAEMLLGAY